MRPHQVCAAMKLVISFDNHKLVIQDHQNGLRTIIMPIDLHDWCHEWLLDHNHLSHDHFQVLCQCNFPASTIWAHWRSWSLLAVASRANAWAKAIVLGIHVSFLRVKKTWFVYNHQILNHFQTNLQKFICRLCPCHFFCHPWPQIQILTTFIFHRPDFHHLDFPRYPPQNFRVCSHVSEGGRQTAHGTGKWLSVAPGAHFILKTHLKTPNSTQTWRNSNSAGLYQKCFPPKKGKHQKLGLEMLQGSWKMTPTQTMHYYTGNPSNLWGIGFTIRLHQVWFPPKQVPFNDPWVKCPQNCHS